MNTSNIDTLALAAAEARASEAKTGLMQHAVNMSSRKGLDDAWAATTNHSIQDSTALPPLPPLPPPNGVAAVPVSVANQLSHSRIRGIQQEELHGARGDIAMASLDKSQVVAQPHQQEQEPTQKATAPKSTRRKPTFAEKLQLILSNKQLSSLITWLPSGKSFCILDKNRFVQRVLPIYFREAKFGEQLWPERSMMI